MNGSKLFIYYTLFSRMSNSFFFNSCCLRHSNRRGYLVAVTQKKVESPVVYVKKFLTVRIWKRLVFLIKNNNSKTSVTKKNKLSHVAKG